MLKASEIWNGCASQERVAIIKWRANYCYSYGFRSLSSERSTNVTQRTNMEKTGLTCFRHLLIKGHFWVKVNTQSPRFLIDVWSLIGEPATKTVPIDSAKAARAIAYSFCDFYLRFELWSIYHFLVTWLGEVHLLQWVWLLKWFVNWFEEWMKKSCNSGVVVLPQARYPGINSHHQIHDIYGFCVCSWYLSCWYIFCMVAPV